MKKFLILIALLGNQIALAKALSDVAVGKPACFGREYSSKHMAKNPSQTVQKITLKFRKDQGSSEVLFLDIDAMIRRSRETDKDVDHVGKLKPYVSAMACEKLEETSMRCTIDCDGGSAEVRWDVKNSGNKILFVNKGFQLYGGCGEDEDDSANWIWLDPKQDPEFNLVALPEEYCQE